MLPVGFLRSFSKRVLPPRGAAPCRAPRVGYAVKGEGGQAGPWELPPPQLESSPAPRESAPTGPHRPSRCCLAAAQTSCGGCREGGGQGEDPPSSVIKPCCVWTPLKGPSPSALGDVRTPGLMSCVPLGT